MKSKIDCLELEYVAHLTEYENLAKEIHLRIELQERATTYFLAIAGAVISAIQIFSSERSFLAETLRNRPVIYLFLGCLALFFPLRFLNHNIMISSMGSYIRHVLSPKLNIISERLTEQNQKLKEISTRRKETLPDSLQGVMKWDNYHFEVNHRQNIGVFSAIGAITHIFMGVPALFFIVMFFWDKSHLSSRYDLTEYVGLLGYLTLLILIALSAIHANRETLRLAPFITDSNVEDIPHKSHDHCVMESFGGDKKVGDFLLKKFEFYFKGKIIPLIPKYIQTYHLTLLTLPFTIFVLILSYLAKFSLQWLWGISLIVVLQYLSDLFDGELGRQRKTGLIRWGFFSDHLFDYCFFTALIFSYIFLIPTEYLYINLIFFVLFSILFLCCILNFAATNEFQVYFFQIGPSELRLMFIVLNSLVIFIGTTFLFNLFVVLNILTLVILFILAYKIQKRLWKVDKENKEK